MITLVPQNPLTCFSTLIVGLGVQLLCPLALIFSQNNNNISAWTICPQWSLLRLRCQPKCNNVIMILTQCVLSLLLRKPGPAVLFWILCFSTKARSSVKDMFRRFQVQKTSLVSGEGIHAEYNVTTQLTPNSPSSLYEGQYFVSDSNHSSSKKFYRLHRKAHR